MIDRLKVKELLEQDSSNIDAVIDSIEGQVKGFLQGEEIEKGGLRKLPRLPNGDFSEVFTTTDHQYRMVFAHSASFERWTNFDNLQMPVGFGSSFENMLNHLSEIENAAFGDGTFAEARKKIYAICQALKQSTQGVYDNLSNDTSKNVSPIIHCAAAMILREDEKSSDPIDEKIHFEKIEDFAKHFQAQDFFLLLATSIAGLKNHYVAIQKEIEEIKGKVKI